MNTIGQAALLEAILDDDALQPVDVVVLLSLHRLSEGTVYRGGHEILQKTARVRAGTLKASLRRLNGADWILLMKGGTVILTRPRSAKGLAK